MKFEIAGGGKQRVGGVYLSGIVRGTVGYSGRTGGFRATYLYVMAFLLGVEEIFDLSLSFD